MDYMCVGGGGHKRFLLMVPLARSLRTCAKDPSETVASRLRNMTDIFIQHFEDPREKSGLGRGGCSHVLHYI